MQPFFGFVLFFSFGCYYLKQGTGNGQRATGNGQRGNEKWEQNRELKMKLLRGLGFSEIAAVALFFPSFPCVKSSSS